MSSSKRKLHSSTTLLAPDTPDQGRSRRQSTMLVSAATRSAILQSSASPPKHLVEDTPDNTVNFKGAKVVEETPDDVDDTVFDTSQVPDTARNPKSILKTKHGPTRVRNLPTLLPGEETFVSQSERVALSSTVLDTSASAGAASPGGRRRGRGRLATESLNISGVGPLTPEVKSAKKEERKRGRRSNVSREDFLNFVFEKEERAVQSPVNEVALGEDSDSSDDGWEALKNSDGSIKKFLPKANNKTRKSVVISGNIKSRTKKQLSESKGKSRKVKKKLNEELKSEDTIVEIVEEEEKSTPKKGSKNFTMIDESNITTSRRKSQQRPGVVEVSPVKSSAASKSSLTLSGENSHNNLSMNSQNFERTRFPLSFQNFSTDSAKAAIAAMEKQVEEANALNNTRKESQIDVASPIDESVFLSPKKRGRPKKSSLFAPNFDSIETPPARKRKSDDTNNVDSKKSKSMNVATNSPMEIASSVVKSRRPVTELRGEKTSLTPTPMEMTTPSPVRRSGRDSTRISTIATANAMKVPIDPVFQEVAAQIPVCPPTQKAPILEGVVIFVDFRMENENRGNVIKAKAKELGATVADKLTADVTHVIFKDGSRFNYQKSKKLGLHILSAGWLEESKKEGRKMPESQFPSVSIERYDSPGLFPKMKKMKSMQPKTLDEDFERASKAQDRKQKILEKKLLKEKEAEKLKNPMTSIHYPPHEHYYKGSPHNTSRLRRSNSNQESPLNQILKEIGTSKHLNKPPKTSLNLSPTESEFDTPLAKRLAGRYQSPLLSRDVGEASTSKSTYSANNEDSASSHPRTPRKARGDSTALMTSNLDTTVRPRKANSKTNDTKEVHGGMEAGSTKNDDTIKVNETVEESPVMRRSRRSTTAISTLATSQAVAQEIHKKDIIAGQEVSLNTSDAPKADESPDYKELLPSPVVVGRRGRGRPKRTVADPSEASSSIFGNPQLESTRLAPKTAALSKTGVGDPQLESTRLAPRPAPKKSPPKPISPVLRVSKPKIPSAAENDLIFDALLQGKPITPSPPKPVEKPRKFVPSNTLSKPPAPSPPTREPVESPQTSMNMNTSKSPRIIAPWRHLAEFDKPEKTTEEEGTDDVCEFSGFPDDPPSKKKEAAPIVTRRKSKETQKTRDTSYGRPSRVKMFMVAPHGAYSGYATGIKRKLEQNANKSQSQSPLRSPLRSPMRSPLRAGLGSPRGETSQARSPRFSVGSPRASPSQRNGSPRVESGQRIGSPRVDASQRIGSPRIDSSPRLGSPRLDPSQRIVGSPRVERVNPYSSPSNRIGGSPSHKGYGSPRTKHGILLVDVPTDKPGISLTGFSPDYNIVEAVGKHHPTSAAVGKPPNKSITNDNNDEASKTVENGKGKSMDAGIAASKAVVLHNDDGTVSVVTKDVSNINATATNQSGPVDTNKKSMLLSRIFSKPPSKDAKDEEDSKMKPDKIEEANTAEEKNNSKSLKNKRKLFPANNNLVLDETADPNTIGTTDNIENVHCDEPIRKKRNRTVIRKNSGELVAEPPSLKPSRNASKRITSMKEASSDSESVNSNASEDLSKASQLLSEPEVSSKKVGKKKVKKMAPPRRSSFDFEPPPKFLKKKEEKNSQEEENGPGRSRRGKVSRVNTPTPVSNIVCTSCHKDDINLVKQLVKMFGTFSFSTSVTPNTSHVVSGEGKRTLNLLKGLLQGCWIVTKEWVLSSLEESKWVDEEPYEMVDFSPAVRNLRQEKGAFLGAFKSELFKDVGAVYVSNNCRAPKEELKQLITSGGGTVANVTRVANVVVGEARAEEDADCVTEKWILDSVQFHVIMPFSDYPIQ